MKIINLEQGSPEWLAWRTYGVGASDCGYISGSNPYKTVFQLWQVKCGFAEEDAPNRAMYHGMMYEPAARDWVNREMELNLVPLCVEDETRSYFKASLDGYDVESGTLVEIKCPTTDKALDEARENGTVHAYWIDQVQWQIMLTGAKNAFIALWDYRTKDCIVIRVFPDSSRILKLIDAAESFWQKVRTGIPPELTDKDFPEITSSELRELFRMYAEQDAKEKAAKTAKEKLKERIIEFGDGKNFLCDGHKVYSQVNPFRYDFNQMKEDGIDLEKYKSKPTQSFRIRINKKNVIDLGDYT